MPRRHWTQKVVGHPQFKKAKSFRRKAERYELWQCKFIQSKTVERHGGGTTFACLQKLHWQPQFAIWCLPGLCQMWPSSQVTWRYWLLPKDHHRGSMQAQASTNFKGIPCVFWKCKPHTIPRYINRQTVQCGLDYLHTVTQNGNIISMHKINALFPGKSSG